MESRSKKENEKIYILDPCCGSRMFWFDKNNPNVLFADNRKLNITLCDGRKLQIKPDEIIDFRNMPYEDNSFKLVVFDPPHLIHAGEKSWLRQKYGILPEQWQAYIKQGFDECTQYPTSILVKITQHQTPWEKAYYTGVSNVISLKSIKKYFSEE